MILHDLYRTTIQKMVLKYEKKLKQLKKDNEIKDKENKILKIQNTK